MKRLLNRLMHVACAATLLLCQGVYAAPISFIDLQYEATAVATTSDGPPGFNSGAGALGGELVAVSADSLGPIDVATAGVILGTGFLSASADVSAGGVSSATAVARLFGSFLNAGPVNLDIGYTPSSFSDGSGDASTSLFILLISDGVTLFSDYVSGPWQFSYAARLGSTSVLDVTLTSEVSAAFLAAGPGNANASGIVTILGTVPEASSWALSLLGLALLGAMRRRQVQPVTDQRGAQPPHTGNTWPTKWSAAALHR